MCIRDRSLINSPEILLLDEPTASMDPDVAQRTREYLKRIIKSKNTSIIYTSHNMYEMQQVSDRIIFLNEGRIVAEGTADEIISLYKGTNLEDVFLKIARSDDGEG
jgi:ABC-2 type transport system ATP-binding protein